MLKNLIIIFSFLFFQATAYADVKIPIEVVKIKDGDTIDVKIDNNIFPVRLIGIDCFETSKIHRAYKQAYVNNISIEDVIKTGNESKQFLINLYSASKNTYLDFKGIDKYNRALGIIYFDKTNVNEMLKSKGGCLAYGY